MKHKHASTTIIWFHVISIGRANLYVLHLPHKLPKGDQPREHHQRFHHKDTQTGCGPLGFFSQCKLRIIDLNLGSHLKQRVDYTYDQDTIVKAPSLEQLFIALKVPIIMAHHRPLRAIPLVDLGCCTCTPLQTRTWLDFDNTTEKTVSFIFVVFVVPSHIMASLPEARYRVHPNHPPYKYRVPIHQHRAFQPRQKIHQHQLHPQFPTLGKHEGLDKNSQGKGRPGLMTTNCR